MGLQTNFKLVLRGKCLSNTLDVPPVFASQYGFTGFPRLREFVRGFSDCCPVQIFNMVVPIVFVFGGYWWDCRILVADFGIGVRVLRTFWAVLYTGAQ